jgi:putative membrane protein
MRGRFLSDEAKEALRAAIRAVEEQSSAEVVIAVRARSGSYHHVGFAAGAVAAFGALAFTLFSPWEFSLWSILLDPVLVGALAGLAASQMPPLLRWLTPTSIRRRWVRRAAQATFYEKGIRLTRGRTGLLVYVSMLERMVEVVCDSAVSDAVARGPWDHAVGELQAAVARGDGGVEVARGIERLAEVLAPVLPRAEDDENELPDEVCAS